MRLLASTIRVSLIAFAMYPAIALAQPAIELAPPALDVIEAEDLRSDLFEFASDGMRGRRAGTLDELRAAAWLAQAAQEAGLEPAGMDGTFFQFFHVERKAFQDGSRVSLGGEALAFGRQILPVAPTDTELEAAIVTWAPGVDVRGKIAVFEPPPPTSLEGVRGDMDAIQHFFSAAMQQLPLLIASGASGIIVVTDPMTTEWFDTLAHMLPIGNYALEGAGDVHGMMLPIPILVAHPDAMASAEEGASMRIELSTVSYQYPSVNVVARVPGSDDFLADEHVLFSAHLDHDGVGEIDGEAVIWNGADDNGSGSVALLAIGRAFAAEPGRRSALFVWHGAEERGLLGSRLYSERPTVNREGIVAVLNADMIGRNHPDTTAILGVRAGNRNSRDLADMALEANEVVTRFVIDHSWDEPDHPENFWQRSDHFPYAIAGFPALFFTTGLHPQYHTPADTPDLIDYDKLAEMARWIYATGWLVANADERPALDSPAVNGLNGTGR